MVHCSYCSVLYSVGVHCTPVVLWFIVLTVVCCSWFSHGFWSVLHVVALHWIVIYCVPCCILLNVSSLCSIVIQSVLCCICCTVLDCVVWFTGLGASDGSGCTETENPAAPGTVQWCILAGDASQKTTCEPSISLGQCLNICDHWQWHWPLAVNMVHCVLALCKASVCAEMKELHTFVGGSWCFDDGNFEDVCVHV